MNEHTLPQQDGRPAMTSGGRVLFENFQPAVMAQLHESLTSQAIGQLLGDLLQRQVGVPTDKRLRLDELQPAVRGLCVSLGGVAVRATDPDWVTFLVEAAVTETDEWVGGPGKHGPEALTLAEIIKHGITVYQRLEREGR